MKYSEIFKTSFLEGFTGTDINTTKVLVTLLITSVLALYIFFIYRLVTRKSFFSKSFNITVAIISVVTAGVVLSMQASLVISLGMVGALSIIRFRTPVKEPLDLLFLFWSVSVGMICGSGLYEVAIITSLIVTIGLLTLELIPVSKASLLLVVNSSNIYIEELLIKELSLHCSSYDVKSRNVTLENADFVIDVKTKDEYGLIKAVLALDEIKSASLLSHDGEVSF